MGLRASSRTHTPTSVLPHPPTPSSSNPRNSPSNPRRPHLLNGLRRAAQPYGAVVRRPPRPAVVGAVPHGARVAVGQLGSWEVGRLVRSRVGAGGERQLRAAVVWLCVRWVGARVSR